MISNIKLHTITRDGLFPAEDNPIKSVPKIFAGSHSGKIPLDQNIFSKINISATVIREMEASDNGQHSRILGSKVEGEKITHNQNDS
jgi:hypothetical protein